MLDLRNVTVTYGGRPAVSAVDLQVPDGTVLGLLGPSGCGKSTLLRAIAGLEPVASGQISWDGADLTRVPVHHRGFGLMFQDGVLFPHRDVAGNIAYGLQRAGLSRAAIVKRVGELLELVGLPGYAARRVTTLSGGEAQRVALARALAPKPRLLLLDEPLAALDRSLRERLLGDLRSVLTSTGTTAVFVTHDQGEAFAVADRLAVMRSGTVRQVGSATQVWQHPIDAWVAGFVGYSAILEAPAAVAIGAELPGTAQALGLRPTALVPDPLGRLTGQVVFLAPTPGGQLLTVIIENVGQVQAMGPADLLVAVGETIRLRLNPAATAVIALPADPVSEEEPSAPELARGPVIVG